MAKFGLFRGASEEPSQEYEADYMLHSGDIVTFMKLSKNSSVADRQVGVVKLDVNESIKPIQPLKGR